MSTCSEADLDLTKSSVINSSHDPLLMIKSLAHLFKKDFNDNIPFLSIR